MEKTELALFPIFHLWNFSEVVLRKILERAGFKDIVICADEHIPVLRVLATRGKWVSDGQKIPMDYIQTNEVPEFIANCQKRRKKFIDGRKSKI